MNLTFELPAVQVRAIDGLPLFQIFYGAEIGLSIGT